MGTVDVLFGAFGSLLFESGSFHDKWWRLYRTAGLSGKSQLALKACRRSCIIIAVTIQRLAVFTVPDVKGRNLTKCAARGMQAGDRSTVHQLRENCADMLRPHLCEHKGRIMIHRPDACRSEEAPHPHAGVRVPLVIEIERFYENIPLLVLPAI